jgi:hypothetical protein
LRRFPILQEFPNASMEEQKSRREAAYEAAGRYVVDHCDLLIAVWDRKPAQGRGGTVGKGGEQIDAAGPRTSCYHHRIRQRRIEGGSSDQDYRRRRDRTSDARRTAEALELRGVTSMSVSQIAKRVARVEQVLCPRHDENSCTLEELCRSMWQQDKAAFMELGDVFPVELFRGNFEREDALARE